MLRNLGLALVSLGARIPAINLRFGLKARIYGPWEMKDRLWFHGASLGECRVLCELAKRLPHIPVFLTTQKAEIAEWLQWNAPAQVKVGLAPLDHPHVLQTLFAQGLPKALVLGEHEVWPCWLEACHAKKIPVAIVSGRMTAKAEARWSFAKNRLRKCLQQIDVFWLQTLADAERYIRYGAENVRVAGNWKWLSFEGHEDAQWDDRLVDLALISVHREEWKFLGDGILKLVEFGSCVVVVPRVPAESKWFTQKLTKLGVPCCVWPELKRGHVSIVSEFGLVPAVLKESHLAFVGGSFMISGVHNVREPLTQLVPVLVGPHQGTETSEILKLEQQGVARVIKNLTDLCVGNEGRDLWLPGWYPWAAYLRITNATGIQKNEAEQGFVEFKQWIDRVI